jgi:uncharacterized protein (TIGR02118 family)
MTIIVSVLYKQGTTFDMDYYRSTHMPLVQEKWGPYGLKSWQVIQLPPDSPYIVQATLEWDSAEDVQKAQASSAAKDIFGDIPNFASPADPVVISGQVLFSSTSA